MKFYNPFKDHIVEFSNGKFAVRRLACAWYWEYKEHSTFFGDKIQWWNTKTWIEKWCMIDTLQETIILRDKDKKPKENKVVKIHG